MCGVNKRVGRNIDASVHRWLGRIERMENSRVAKRFCDGKDMESHPVVRTL